MTAKDMQACEHAYAIWKKLKSDRAEMNSTIVKIVVHPEITDEQLLEFRKKMIDNELKIRELQAAFKNKYQRIAPRYMNFDL